MPATWTTISTLRWCAASWKAQNPLWSASILTASLEMFLVPPLAIAANLSRAHWPPSPRKTAASFCTCTTLDAVSASIRPRNPEYSRKFISTNAASSIANRPASAWSSMKVASASPTRSPCASTSPSPPTKPYDQAKTATSASHSERSEDHFLSARLLRGESAFSSGAYDGGSSSSASVFGAAGCVEVLPGDFAGGALDFAQPEQPGAGTAFLELGFPATKYLRIFSRRFGPRPRIASKSSTLLKAPYDLRICKILSAVAGPMPGTCCSSSEVAVLMFTGCAGGFFFERQGVAATHKVRTAMETSRTVSARAAISGAV